ncbi:MAG: hypothetical protein B6245_24070 [Desulfobacteraceae bacterium 4572_88]|nr:MAG: hypothetical protein B6245_24070 [Desulfobacteraceae bacterium 4572_88]
MLLNVIKNQNPELILETQSERPVAPGFKRRGVADYFLKRLTQFGKGRGRQVFCLSDLQSAA